MNVSDAIFEPERGIPLFDISLCSPVVSVKYFREN